MDFEIHEQPVSLESQDYTLERNKPMPSFNHGTIQANLIFAIMALYRNQYRVTSETSLALENWPSVPDISIFPKSMMDLRNDEIAVKTPPLCVVEILSPTQNLTELTSKAYGYFQHGVKSCWIVLPMMANIYVYSSPDEYDIFRSTETLVDKNLDISFPLEDVFK
jgi:Uma2 family endonuclease